MKIRLVMPYHYNLYDTIMQLKKKHDVAIITPPRVRPIPDEIPHIITDCVMPHIRTADVVITKHIESHPLVHLYCKINGIRRIVYIQKAFEDSMRMSLVSWLMGNKTEIVASSREAFCSAKFYFKKVRYTQQAVDKRRFLNKKYRKKGNTFNLLCVAKYLKRKNHYYLIKALQELICKHHDIKFHLTCIGTIQDKYIYDWLKDVASNLMPIEVWENVPNNDMPYYYNCADLLILPASSEMLGYCVCEAMASGLAVICSDEVGAKDYILDECVFGVKSVDEIVRSVERYINKGKIDWDKLKEEGENNRESV